MAFCDRSNKIFVFFQRRPEEYKKKVAEYVKKYATEDALRETDKVRLDLYFLVFVLAMFSILQHWRIASMNIFSGGPLLFLRELDVGLF